MRQLLFSSIMTSHNVTWFKGCIQAPASSGTVGGTAVVGRGGTHMRGCLVLGCDVHKQHLDVPVPHGTKVDIQVETKHRHIRLEGMLGGSVPQTAEAKYCEVISLFFCDAVL